MEIKVLFQFQPETLMIGDETCILAPFRDITEKKRIEDSIRISEEKFTRLFRSSPDTIMLSRLSDGIITEVNDSTCINLGYTKDELIGQSTLQLNIWVKPEEREQYTELLKKNQRVNNFEATFRMKSGEIRVGLMSSEIIHLFNDVYIFGFHT